MSKQSEEEEEEEGGEEGGEEEEEEEGEEAEEEEEMVEIQREWRDAYRVHYGQTVRVWLGSAQLGTSYFVHKKHKVILHHFVCVCTVCVYVSRAPPCLGGQDLLNLPRAQRLLHQAPRGVAAQAELWKAQTFKPGDSHDSHFRFKG
jgi:hypothetical protein